LQDFGTLKAFHETIRAFGVESERIKHGRRVALRIEIAEEIGEAAFTGEGHDAGPLALAHAADIAEHLQIDAPTCRFRLDRICEIGPGATRISVAWPILRPASETD
jgi:hypothetical protein